MNSTGLTIHNVTDEDFGEYSCLVNKNGKLLNAIISLTIVCKIVCVCMCVCVCAALNLLLGLS